MPTHVRSFSKINLGLAIGPVQDDGFHALTTMYQTLDLHDLVTVTAQPAAATRITLTTNHPQVPTDERNTAWKMVERALTRLNTTAEVAIHIDKNLPVQGGMGAGSANAAAALLGLEKELGLTLDGPARLELAAEIGSDVPLFLIGGSVLGTSRGEKVSPLPDLPAIPCVVAIPSVGVSTPQAFRDWDARAAASSLTSQAIQANLEQLSLAYSSVLAKFDPATISVEPGTSGIAHDRNSVETEDGRLNDLAENTLLALVRTGIGNGLQNDFEEVVFPQYPSLRENKRQLMGSDSGSPALYAALSGSGSALFGLYRSRSDARAAQQRVQASGTPALLTTTLPRSDYWRRMFAG
ncbi:MAG: 4-(cytidine 5'-diphospho)-2-C-methyl-D-erythritol kinase [Granulicella sp.]